MRSNKRKLVVVRDQYEKRPAKVRVRKRRTVPSPLLRKRKRERDELEKEIRRLQQANERLQSKLNRFEADERWRKREQAANWAAFDRCNDAVTSHEVELFHASPAYQKYQQWRRDGYIAEEGKRVDTIKYLQARGRLDAGDWMSP